MGTATEKKRLLGNRFTPAIHILVLTGFALAQPLYDILAKHPEFFVARQSQPIDIWVFIGVVSLLVPLIIVALQWTLVRVAGLFKLPLQPLVMAVVITILIALIVLPVLKKTTGFPDNIIILIAVTIGVVATVAYFFLEPIRRFITVLSPAIIIFPIIFILTPAIKSLLFPSQLQPSPNSQVIETKSSSVDDSTPIVFVIFDELPTSSLMKSTGSIDEQRFKHFAALADNSHWFRNASTVAEGTVVALPAILTGNKPRPLALATNDSYPNNLFTWLGPTHKLNVTEQVTRLCPSTYCPQNEQQDATSTRLKLMADDLAVVYQHQILPKSYATHLPAIENNWKDFNYASEVTPNQSDISGTEDTARAQQDQKRRHRRLHNRRQQFEDFVASIQREDKPVLHFFHSMLPHAPYDYLPSGKIYGVTTDLPGHKAGRWGDDQWAVDRNYQRHLMQLGFVDGLLGTLFTKLKNLALYDEALIVVLSDHGVSFDPGTTIRSLNEGNVHNILPVPFFVKLPHQSAGVVHDHNVSLLDVMPTLAQGLDMNLAWPADGRSALETNLERDDKKNIYFDRGRKFLTLTQTEFIERRQRVIEHKEDVLADAAQTPGFLTNSSVAQFIGKPVNELPVIEDADASFEFDQQFSFDNFDPDGGFVPVRLSARVNLARAKTPDYVGISVNGNLWAIDRPIEIKDSSAHIRSFIPESALKPGENEATAWLVYGESPAEFTFAKAKTQVRQSTPFELKKNWRGAVTGLINSDGNLLSISGEPLEGWLDQIRLLEGVVMFSGWAAMKDRSAAVERIAIFLDGEFLWSGEPNVTRKHVQLPKVNGDEQYPGFSFHLPMTAITSGITDDVRAFAISKQGNLLELEYGDDFQWLQQTAAQ